MKYFIVSGLLAIAWANGLWFSFICGILWIVVDIIQESTK